MSIVYCHFHFMCILQFKQCKISDSPFNGRGISQLKCRVASNTQNTITNNSPPSFNILISNKILSYYVIIYMFETHKSYLKPDQKNKKPATTLNMIKTTLSIGIRLTVAILSVPSQALHCLFLRYCNYIFN